MHSEIKGQCFENDCFSFLANLNLQVKEASHSPKNLEEGKRALPYCQGSTGLFVLSSFPCLHSKIPNLRYLIWQR